MDVDFASIADDFFVNLNLQTTLALPESRETVLHFCEAVQKEFRSMTSLYHRETGEYVLEGDRDSGSYQWLEMQSNRLSAGCFNPPQLADAYRMHHWLVERSVYYLGIGGLDVESLDLLFGFNLDFVGNRDAIVAEALLGGSSLAALITDTGAQCIECEPSLVISVDEACCEQARLSLETRSSSFQVRTGQYHDEPISVYLTVRKYPCPGEVLDPVACLVRQGETAEDITCRIVVPHVIQPIAAAIAAAR